MKQIPKYFLQGLLYVVPISITIYVVLEIIYLLDSILSFEVPGLGILIMFSFITLAGYLGSNILSSSMGQLLKYGEKMILRIPFVKILYTAMKDLIKAFMGKEKTFNKPVLVRLSKESNIEKIGFITRSSLTEIGIKEGKVAVYLPHSYAFSGNMFIVDSDNVTPIDASSAEIMKLIVSGGVASVGATDESKEEENKAADAESI
jgi:uncharacterized membrane protein